MPPLPRPVWGAAAPTAVAFSAAAATAAATAAAATTATTANATATTTSVTTTTVTATTTSAITIATDVTAATAAPHVLGAHAVGAHHHQPHRQHHHLLRLPSPTAVAAVAGLHFEGGAPPGGGGGGAGGGGGGGGRWRSGGPGDHAPPPAVGGAMDAGAGDSRRRWRVRAAVALPPLPLPPRPYEEDVPDGLCHMSDSTLATALASILTAGGGAVPPPAPLPPPTCGASLFYSTSPQPFPLVAYTSRLVTYAGASRAALLGALDLLSRAGAASPLLRLSDRSVHRLLVAAVTVAAKVVDDEVFSNAHYAAVGGVPSVPEMNALEAHLLRVLGWEVGVSPDAYRRWEWALLLHAGGAAGAGTGGAPPGAAPGGVVGGAGDGGGSCGGGGSRGVVGSTAAAAAAAAAAAGSGVVTGAAATAASVASVMAAAVGDADTKPAAAFRVGLPPGATVRATVPATHGLHAVGA
ncbi:hypothetical protein MMPV_005912 [Pyropia vietnamensis]